MMQRGQSSKDKKADLLKGTMKKNWRVKLPMSPDEALDIYGDALTELEWEEIVDFPQVWFVGHMAKKVQAAKDKPNNFGHDDERHFYLPVINDHIAYRYEIRKVMGQGSSGQVVKCWDHKVKKYVAIKILQNNSSVRESAESEVEILRYLGRADEDDTHNIVRMKDVFDFRGHLCICLELLGDNLREEMKKRGSKGWSQAQVRSNAISLLKCLQLLKKSHIIHCDLKPSNIVTSRKGAGHIKVIDFGLAHYDNQLGFKKGQALCYRPPEVLMNVRKDSGTEMDMWSLGCILAEFSTGKVLFFGDDEMDQLAVIMKVLGLDPVEVQMTARDRTRFFDPDGKSFCYPLQSNSKLGRILKARDPNFLDFIGRCLKVDPRERMTPDEAMQHPWIGLHHQGSKPKAPAACKKPERFSSVNGQRSLYSKTPSVTTADSPKPSIREEMPLLKTEKMAPVTLAEMQEIAALRRQNHVVLKCPKVSGEQATGQKLPQLAKAQQIIRGGNVKTVRLLQQDGVGQSSKPKVPAVCKKPEIFSSHSDWQMRWRGKTASITTQDSPKPSIKEEMSLLKTEKLALVTSDEMEEIAALRRQNHMIFQRPKVSGEHATGQQLPQLAKAQQILREGNVKPVRLLQQDGVGQSSQPKVPAVCKKPESFSSINGQRSLHSKTSFITTAAAPKTSIREERSLVKKEKMAPVRQAMMEDSSSRELDGKPGRAAVTIQSCTVLKYPKMSGEKATGQRLPQPAEVQRVTRGGIVRARRLLQEDTVGRSRGESRLGVRFTPL